VQIEKREVAFKNKEGEYITINKESLQVAVKYFAKDLETGEVVEVDETTWIRGKNTRWCPRGHLPKDKRYESFGSRVQ